MLLPAVISLILLALTAFVAYKLAEEKGQNKIIWTVVSLLIGPLGLVIQYMVWLYQNNKLSFR